MKAGNVRPGSYLVLKGEPVVVLAKDFAKLGRGAGLVKLKVQSLTSGATWRQVVNSHHELTEALVEHRPAQFLYQDGESFAFINPQTYEQEELSSALVGKKSQFLTAGVKVRLVYFEGRVIGVELPKKVALKVVKAEKAVRGDTVSGASKPVVLETGLVVKAPLFIRKGDVVWVSPETGEYLSRKSGES